ncbi:unnamed protein product [Moneuplotes crassus]|uniref:Uncharacterized protein n=1 Tax=Euplotes crassus TaxID=5936 RepID=A0AAD1U8F0_EUPCR|nr:unnamed protein product [Moneuplotes crassus]
MLQKYGTPNLKKLNPTISQNQKDTIKIHDLPSIKQKEALQKSTDSTTTKKFKPPSHPHNHSTSKPIHPKVPSQPSNCADSFSASFTTSKNRLPAFEKKALEKLKKSRLGKCMKACASEGRSKGCKCVEEVKGDSENVKKRLDEIEAIVMRIRDDGDQVIRNRYFKARKEREGQRRIDYARNSRIPLKDPYQNMSMDRKLRRPKNRKLSHHLPYSKTNPINHPSYTSSSTLPDHNPSKSSSLLHPPKTLAMFKHKSTSTENLCPHNPQKT